MFTEQGVAMLSSVLRSKKVIQINIQIINTFVQMRKLAIEHKDFYLTKVVSINESNENLPEPIWINVSNITSISFKSFLMNRN